jgi:hypothetical protein
MGELKTAPEVYDPGGLTHDYDFVLKLQTLGTIGKQPSRNSATGHTKECPNPCCLWSMMSPKAVESQG